MVGLNRYLSSQPTLNLHEFSIHLLDFCPCDIRLMSPEASPEAMGDMEDLMDQHLSLIFSAEPIKPFGEDLDDIMRVL